MTRPNHSPAQAVRPDDGSRCPTARRHAQDRIALDARKQDVAVGSPCTVHADAQRHVTDRHGGTTGLVHPFELARGEESN